MLNRIFPALENRCSISVLYQVVHHVKQICFPGLKRLPTILLLFRQNSIQVFTSTLLTISVAVTKNTINQNERASVT